jgi:hypothetical protein
MRGFGLAHPGGTKFDYSRHCERIVGSVVLQKDDQVFCSSVVVRKYIAFAAAAISVREQSVQVAYSLRADCPVALFVVPLEPLCNIVIAGTVGE